MALGSTLWYLPPFCGSPSAWARLDLQVLQRLGSFLNCLSWKKSCSPAVNTKSAPQSTHLRTLSWNSIESAPFPAFILKIRPENLGFLNGHLRTNPYHGFGPTQPQAVCLQQKTYETKLE